MRRGRAKRRLPDSLTQHLSDPKIVAFRPRTGRRSPYRVSGLVEKLAVSAVPLTIIALAGGHLLRAW
jgi:hypothetical protein